MTPIDLCLISGQTAPDDPYTLEYCTICQLRSVIGSLQTDNWLLRYGHFKVWREVENQKLSLLLVYMPSGLCKLCVNFVFSAHSLRAA